MLDTSKPLEGRLAIYKIDRPLSQEGAMGKTYMASVDELKPYLNQAEGLPPLQRYQPVVIKLPPTLDAKKYKYDQQRRFLERVNKALGREYGLFSRLSDTRSAAHVYDRGMVDVVIGKGTEYSFFLVSEYVQGPRLDIWRESHREALSVDEFFTLARRLAEALSDIHRAGVVHGDIWPKNIILHGDNEPVFIDFGEAVIREQLTAQDKSEKSHPYMAPERERTVQGDIYSLCATLFYLAAGSEPIKVHGVKDRVKEAVIDGLRGTNIQLYRENSGVADIIARGLRTREYDRTPDTERLLQDIDLFDPKTESIDKNLSVLASGIPGKLLRIESAEPIFMRMIGTRIRQLDRNIDEMLQGIHDLTGDHETLVMALAQYLSVCGSGDEYLTASVPWLWYEQNMGVKGRLRSINKQIAKRGTTVRRVFVVTPGDLNNAKAMAVLTAHAEMLNEIDEEGSPAVNTTEREIERGGVFTGVIVLTEEDRERKFRDNPHSGIWIRGSNVKVLLPLYDEETMTGVHLAPGQGEPEAIRLSFHNEYLTRATEIREFLSNYHAV